MAERSMIVGGCVLPVCARCTGIYFGICLSILYFLWKKRMYGNRLLTGAQFVLPFCFLPFMVDGAGSYLGFWESNQWLRILTGVLAGFSFPYFFILILNFKLDGNNTFLIYKNTKEMFGLLGMGIVGAIWIGLGGFGLYTAISAVLCFGILCFYAMLFGLFLHLVFKKEKINKRLIGWALILAGITIAGIGCIRA